MTRDNRTISAVFMAVVLILASGTAVSLAVTESSTSDVGTNAVAVQDETTTPEETTPEEDGVETTPEEEEQPASITLEDQETDGETVVIESVTMEEGGFVAIHDSSVEEAPIASVLGNSVYLEAGTHENVEITLARPIEESQTLVAMPHFDTNDNEVYDFVLSTGEVDGPYTVDGEAITDDAEVTVEEEVETPVETTPETTPVETTPVETTPVETTPEETPTEVETTPEETPTEVETTPEEVVEEPTEERQFIFKIENMEIDEWSFVVGDEEEPDRTEVISDVNIQDRRVEINLTEVLQEQQERAAQETITTPGPEAQEQLEEDLTGDIQTVRFVIRNVDIENVTFVITAPADIEVPEPPEEVETPTPEEVETTPVETTPVETTPVETTPVETTPVETTTPEEVETTPVETTPVETTPVETTPVETTPEEEEVELDSFQVSDLDAPESAEVGETITVSATVSNPNDQEATQDVAFRLDGTVIERESVTLDGNEEATVTFEIDTADVPTGQYIHGIYTRDFGELAIVVLEEPTEAVTTTPAETTTPEEA